MNEKQIINCIEDHAEKSGLSASTICERAVGNSRLYSRLIDGGSCSLRIVNRLTSYIEDNNQKQGAA